MDKITVQNRAIIFRATVPYTDIERDRELRSIEADFKVATGFKIEISLGDSPRLPKTSDLWCKVIYNQFEADSSEIPFNIDTMKMALLSVLRTYFHDDNGNRRMDLQES